MMNDWYMWYAIRLNHFEDWQNNSDEMEQQWIAEIAGFV